MKYLYKFEDLEFGEEFGLHTVFGFADPKDATLYEDGGLHLHLDKIEFLADDETISEIRRGYAPYCLYGEPANAVEAAKVKKGLPL